MAAYAIQFRRGNTTQHNSFTGLLGEVTVDTDKKTLVVHDGSTTGGFPLAREGAASNASSGSFTSNVTIGGTLAVTSTASFSDDVTITGDLGMTGHIIPSANITYDLGSLTHMWRDVYVGPGSLYVNGKKVIEDNAGTINITTDVNQNLKVETTGTGNLQLSSSAGISVNGEVNALTGDLQFGDHLDMNSNRIKEVSAPVDGADAANKTYVDTTISSQLSGGTLAVDATTGDFSGDVTVGGSLTVTGTVTTVNSETIELADNILLLNSNALGNASQSGGIEVERGDDLNVQLLWDETNDRWTVGAEDVKAANFIGDLTGDVTGTVSSLSNHDTDDLVESSTNRFFTPAREAAVNAYADQAEVDATTAAGTYTDARETAITSAYQSYADSAETDAVASAEAKDAVRAAAANAYADQAEADAVASAEAKDAVRATAANAYADQAEADARAYTDTRETAITSAYQSYADTAEADAVASAEAKDVVRATAANAYADQAEADAIASAEAKDVVRATAANAYADQAEADARAYTDTRETAITTAYEAADSTLQTNINTEKSRIDAIMSASTSDADTFAEIVSLVNSVDTTNDSALGTEIANRTSADSTLQTNINNEASTRASADTALSGRLDTIEGTGTGSVAKAQADAQSYADQVEVDAKAYTDTRETAITTAYEAYSDVQKGRVDAILSASSADKDTFAEIVTFVNSVDTTNDTALGTEITTRASADTALSGRLDTIEGSGTGSVAKAEADAIATAEAYTDTRETAITSAYTSAISTAVAGKDNTDEISEGTTNLYHTTARARAAISASGSLSYNSTTGEMSFTMPAQNTTAITEGDNLYYTDARADARVANATGVNLDISNQDTDELSEGSANLYFTDARALAAAKAGMSMTHSGVYVVTTADDTGNTGSSHAITAATLGFNVAGKEFYQVFLNRQLLRPTEYTVNSSNGTITFSTDVIAEDDEIEAVMYG